MATEHAWLLLRWAAAAGIVIFLVAFSRDPGVREGIRRESHRVRNPYRQTKSQSLVFFWLLGILAVTYLVAGVPD